MTIWTSEDAAEAVDGSTGGAWRATSVAIDSRTLEKDALFVALKGERVDGHRFVSDALARGAAAAMVSEMPNDAPRNRLLFVPDTLRALEDLGAYNRARSEARVVAVTGSVGKTSAKEMLKLALSAQGKTFAGHGNFNNHIGTPLNLANLPEDARFAVFELGMNHAGEIAALTSQVRPHAALITTVESVHLEFFDSEEAIADAKAEIFEGVERGGAVALNADNRHFARLAASARARGLRVMSFGLSDAAEYRILRVEGAEVTATFAGETLTYALNAVGAQWALMSAGVLACVAALGGDVRKSAEALASFQELPGRGRVVHAGEILLVDDSYNASPAAMRAAFAKLRLLRERGVAKGRLVAALGDMRELGESAEALHAALAAPLQEAGVDAVFTAGSLMKHLHDALPARMQAGHAADAHALLPLVRGGLQAGDCVLVKGSHGSHMYEVAEALME